MKTVEVEGIKLTPDMIGFIKTFQENPEYMRTQLEAIDEAISLIACSDNPSGKERKALNTISDLCFRKQSLHLFDGKEDQS